MQMFERENVKIIAFFPTFGSDLSLFLELNSVSCHLFREHLLTRIQVLTPVTVG